MTLGMRLKVGGLCALAITIVVAIGGTAVTPPATATPPDPVPRIISSDAVHDRVVALDAASSTTRVRYNSTSVRGRPTEMTGTILLPRSAPPRGGWPLAVWNHMTVGAADSCAPSTGRAGHPELPRMTSGDLIVSHLLDAGFAVVRPDFEGIGGPGPHPYLIGESLARSAIDLAVAAARDDSRIGRDVVVAGHSEGAVAALFTASRLESEGQGLRPRAVAALAPPTQIARMLDAGSAVPVAGPAINELMGLAALIGSGAAAADPAFEQLMLDDGLSPAARRLVPHVEQRCYVGLTGFDSFGGLAPAQLLGPRGSRLKADLLAILDRNDVAHLRFSPDLPIRIEAGTVDTVSPQPLVSDLVATYRRAGVRVIYNERLIGHAGVATEPAGAADVARWLIGQV